MSVPKKVKDIGTASGSLSTKRTDHTYASKKEKPLKRRNMLNDKSDEEPSANYSSFKKEYKSGIAKKSQKMESTKKRRRRCGICWQNLKDSLEFLPASLTCGHSFCRRCILIHLRRQDATGEYTCPTCSQTYLTRPALVPNTSNLKNSQIGEDDNFLMRHKASLKRMIELHAEGITKAGSRFNRMIQIINSNAAGGEEDFISVSDIFKTRNDVRTVITQGVAGIGKTTLVCKFITDWIDGKANEDVDFVLMLPFWKLNLVKDLSCSLHKLLLNFHPEFKELADLKQLDGSNVIVILDGIDEAQFVLDFQNNKLLCDITEASSVDTLMTNIIKGNLLPFAKVWITLHPSSTKQIPSCYINRMTEIPPFSDSQMEECVRECINDVTEASNILQKTKISKHLYSMCHNPALCKIAVSVVKSMLEQGETKMIQTCTELFSHFILSQINAKAETKSSSEQVGGEENDRKLHRKRTEAMLRFSKLALRHLMKTSFTFSGNDLKDHDIDVSDTASLSGIFTEINQENQEEKVFRFTQAIIQEFLAALCVFYAYSTKNMGILQHLLEGMSRFEQEKVSLDILLRCVIDKVLDRMCRHQYFLRFLAGMSLESSQILLQALLTNTSSSSATTESILKHIKDLGKQADVSLETCLNLLHCRIEMQDIFVTEDFMDLLKSPRDFSFIHWSAITTLVQMTVGILGEFNLQNCHPLKRNMALRMFLSNSRRALLSNCGLSVGSCPVVASALQQPHCSLRELDMSGNYLRDSGVQLLASGLKSPNCKLEILRLSRCGLSIQSCLTLNTVLESDHCCLRELDLSHNLPEDSGVNLLTERLRDPSSKLETLKTEPSLLKQSDVFEIAGAPCSGGPSYHLPPPLSSLFLCPSSAQPVMPKFSITAPEPLNPTEKKDNADDHKSRMWEEDFSISSSDELAGYSSCSDTYNPDIFEDCFFTFDPPDIGLGSCGTDNNIKFRALTEYFGQVSADKMSDGVNDPSDVPEVFTPECSEYNDMHSYSITAPYEIIGEPLNSTKNEDDADDRKPRMWEDLLDFSPSSENEFVPQEFSVTVDPLDIKTDDCDGGSCGTDDNIAFRAKTVSADKMSDGVSDPSDVPEVFTPECSPYNDRNSYRLTCSSEGLFQCWYTGLVFKMETAGEVEYRTEPWNCRQLANTGFVPAGPLFDIKCPQGTLSQLRFPHCEVLSGKGRKHLSVIHISDSDQSEILEPHETTDSYVVLNIGGCSKYGATKKKPKKKYSPIHGLVLLFLQESTLNVLLLPKNLDISEVCQRRRTINETVEMYIETTPNCKLIPETTYYLRSDPDGEHEVTPLSAEFLDYENYTNYCPTFQVFLAKLDKVKLNLTEKNTHEPIWCSNVKIPVNRTEGSPSVSSPSSPYTPAGQNFFYKHKAALNARLGTLDPVLSELEKCRVLNAVERDEVLSEKLRLKRNLILLDMLERKGGRAQEVFYKVLKKHDQYLVEDLEGPNEI